MNERDINKLMVIYTEQYRPKRDDAEFFYVGKKIPYRFQVIALEGGGLWIKKVA